MQILVICCFFFEDQPVGFQESVLNSGPTYQTAQMGQSSEDPAHETKPNNPQIQLTPFQATDKNARQKTQDAQDSVGPIVGNASGAVAGVDGILGNSVTILSNQATN